MANTITAANSTFAISVTDLYDTAQTIGGYSADTMFTTDAAENVETVMGVDGTLSAGFVYKPVKQTVSVMPSSTSFTVFNTWALTQRADAEVYFANATIIIPSIGMKYTMTNGVLTSGKFIPDAKHVLQATEFVITWESVTGSVYTL